MRLTVNSDAALQNAIGELREQFKAKRYITVNLSSGKARTLDQNAISHTWYEQVAAELREDTALGVKSFCKLHFGVGADQALERELSELRAAQPQQPAPEFFDAPEQHMQALEQRATQRLYAALEEQARVVHPDYDEVFEEVKAAAESNPAIQQRIFSSANPALAAYQIGKQLREFKRMEDPVKYRAEIEAEVRTKLEAELKAKEQARAAADAAIPPDMTQSRNAAGQYAADSENPIDTLFPRN